MTARIMRMVDKTVTAPYYAQRMSFHRIIRFRPHDFIDFVAIVEGEGLHLSSVHGNEPRKQQLHAGQFVIYRPGDEITIKGVGQGLSVRYVSSPIAEWRIFAAMVGLDTSWATVPDPPLQEFDLSDQSLIEPFETAIDRYHAGASELDLVRFWIDMIPAMFPQSRRGLSRSGSPPWLVESVQAMGEEHNLRGGVARLLELAHVSAPHLSVTIRRFYAKTPTELVAAIRLRHAALLLSTTSDSIGDIAKRCGFSAIAYFSSSFRKEYQLTPSEYRARIATLSAARSDGAI